MAVTSWLEVSYTEELLSPALTLWQPYTYKECYHVSTKGTVCGTVAFITPQQLYLAEVNLYFLVQ